jgi:Tol biopolymer transport system component
LPAARAEQCLRKDPRKRLRHIGDARLQLEAADDDHAVRHEPARGSRVRALVPWAVAALAVIAAVAALLVGSGRPAGPSFGGTRFVLAPAPGAPAPSDPHFAPDGSFVVYRAGKLYVHRLTELEPRPLEGTDHATQVFLSPDGRWVGFYTDRTMKKVALAGGDPLTICDVSADTPGAAWGPGDRIFFTAGWNDSPLLVVSADGGTPAPASTLDKDNRERGHWWPEPLPDGRHVLFTIWYSARGLNDSSIAVLDLETGAHRPLFAGAMARYAAGHLSYYHAGSYHVVPFDLRTLARAGEPRRVLGDALGLVAEGTSARPYTLSAAGSVAYVAGTLYPESRAVWVDRAGRLTPTPVRARFRGRGDLSPEGRRLAIGVAEGGTTRLWVFDLESGASQLQGEGWGPRWYPDGQRLTALALEKGDFDIYTHTLDAAPPQPHMVSDNDEAPAAVLPGGEGLVVHRWSPDGSTVLASVDRSGDNRAVLVSGPFEKGQAWPSPDGRWLAYSAAPNGQWHIYVRPLAGGGARQVSTAALANEPDGLRWSRRTKQLHYLDGADLVSASYDDSAGPFTLVTHGVVARLSAPGQPLGLSADDQRFLVGIPDRPMLTPPPGIRVVLGGLADAMR